MTQFIELILICANALVRNKIPISVRNINVLYNTYLRLRFNNMTLQQLTTDEFDEMISLIRRWEQPKLHLIVDNTKYGKDKDIS